MLKITLTKDFVDWLCEELHYEAEEAVEFAQVFIGLLQASGNITTATPEVEVQCNELQKACRALLRSLSVWHRTVLLAENEYCWIQENLVSDEEISEQFEDLESVKQARKVLKGEA